MYLLVSPHIGDGSSSAYSLDLARVNLNDTDTAGNELFSQAISEAANSGLGSTVYTTTGVGLATSDGTNIDDISMATVRSGKEDRKDGLSHVDETSDICLEHDVDVLLSDFRSPSYALNKSSFLFISYCLVLSLRDHNLRIVDKNINVPPLFRQVFHNALHFGGVAHVKLEWKNLDPIADFTLDLLSQLLKGIGTTRGENES